MQVPEGYLELLGLTQPEGMNCLRLNKALYGLKQASRQWYLHLKKTLGNLGFEDTNLDPCIFKRTEEDGSQTFIAVYVDDLVVASMNEDTIDKLRKQLNDLYDLRDMGDLDYFLGMEIERKDGKFFLSLKKMIKDVLEKFLLGPPIKTSTKSVPLQFDTALNPADEDTKAEDLFDGPYRQAVGCLLYIAVVCIPSLKGLTILSETYQTTLGSHQTHF